MSEPEQNNKFIKKIEIYALATDPIYIGTGGYNIGRVDNTIVRDPITNVPKIPGSSLAGTWRYYVVLEALPEIKEKIKQKLDEIIGSLDIDEEKKNTLNENKEKLNISNFNLLKEGIYKVLGLGNSEEDKETKNKIYESLKTCFKENIFGLDDSNWKMFKGNRFLQITCAGQDNVPQEELANSPFVEKDGKTGHCGHCIVCKGFGFSKKDISWQGLISFSDLQIIFFPVFTMKGTKWITTVSRLKEIGIDNENEPTENKIKTKNGNEGHLNLGWLYLEVEGSHSFCQEINIKNSANEEFVLKPEDLIIVPEDLFSHIVNSNLETRTSVSIDPITGASKEGALFTSEAIPRGTIFYGQIRIFDKKEFEGVENSLKPLPKADDLKQALNDSKHFYETLGIGGMTTRGFGRLVISF